MGNYDRVMPDEARAGPRLPRQGWAVPTGKYRV